MDKEIINLHREEKSADLQNLLSSLDEQQLLALVNQRAVKGKGDPCVLLRAVLSGLPCTSSSTTKKRLALYKHCIDLLQKTELNSKTASGIVGILMLEADEFTASCLAELASLFVDNIKNGIGNGKSLELFPKILTSLEIKEAVAYGGCEMSGAEYKSHILNSLCSGRWESSSVIHLAAMFKDVPLTQDELKFVLTKILRMLKEVELQELPPLVYQILLLSTKGHKRLVLEGIARYFVQQDKSLAAQLLEQKGDEMQVSIISEDQLGLVEGTIILHITFAVKLDQDLGREFIKYLKAEQQNLKSIALAPFCVALALSLSRIHRFEEQIFEFLKSAILKSFKDQEKQSQSAWTRDIVAKTSDVRDWLMETVRHSVHGWDHVIQGLVQLGFTLMDAFGPKAAFGRIVETTNALITTPGQRACQLGADLLLEIFKVHQIVRSEILEQILNRVVTKATAPVSHYLDLLSQTVLSAPQILLDSLPKVREAFDYLSYLPPPTAQALLRSVQPLLKISMTLKDALLLVLRKAMFSRQLDARKTAVSGFLMILKHFRVLGGMPFSQASQSLSASQTQVDVHIPYNPSSNEGLCLEILGNLRRCLTQQADVRMTLYSGLYDVLCRNSQLSLTILSTLHHQLSRYYETQESVPAPVRLEPCITVQGQDVYIAEPLAHLLACTVHCLLKTDEMEDDKLGDDEDNESVLGDLKSVVEALTSRMEKCELADFELDKSADFSLGTSVGVRNNIYALLVSGIYEVLIEYAFQTGDFKESACQTVENLYNNHRRLSDLLKEKPSGGAPGGKRGRPAPGRATASTSGVPSPQAGKGKSLLSLGFLRDVVKALYSDESPRHQAGLTVLRDNLDLQQYLLGVTLQKVSQVSATGTCDGPEGHDKGTVFTYCCSLARVLQKSYTEQVQSPDEHRRERRKALRALTLETLTTIYSLVCTRYRDRLHDYLSVVDQSRMSTADPSDLELPDLLHKMIKKFQRLVISVISGDEDHQSPKEAVLMLTTVSSLLDRLGVDGEQGAQVIAWVKRIATEQNIDDLPLVKSLITQLLQLSTQKHSCAQLLRDLARDMHSQLGDIDQEVEVDSQSSMAVVTPRTSAPTILLLVTGQLDRELDDTEWVIGRLRGALGARTDLTDNDPDSPGLTQREGQEKSLCVRLGHMVNTFHELCQTAVPGGACVDALLKVMCRMYGTLAMLVKYYIQMYQLRCGHMSNRFEKLVKLSGTNLTQFVYAFITYVQAIQNETLQSASEKTKKDKKKQNNVAQAGKARIMKETKSIPNLIFAIEQYERFLIQLTKKSKVNLMDNFKMSTSRDFRINVASLETALAEQEDESEEEEDETTHDDTSHTDPDETQENDPPRGNTSLNTSKRSKVADDKVPKKKSKLGRSVLSKK